MTVKTEQTSSGFSVKFPFELKDQFRTAFPSAKWNATLKQWEVGPRSGKRLEQWVIAVQASGVVEEIEGRDEQDMQAKELAALQSELDRVRTAISAERQRKASAEETQAKMEESLELLKQEQKKLAEEKAVADASVEQAQQATNAAKATLESYVDLKAIYAARDKMSRVTGKVGRQAREQWDDAQSIIRREREKLLAAGLISYGINALAFANHNRPDRDNPMAVTMEKVLTLKKVEPENDA